MKGFFVLVLLAVAAYFAYQKYFAGGPLTIDKPVYAEMRASITEGNREIELAVFVRNSSDSECRSRAQESWARLLKDCPSCKLEAPKCSESLLPRYARLFDNVPIPSTYLSATSSNARWRDGRVVIFGLTDVEGAKICDDLRLEIAKEYKGTLACIPPSGG